MALTPFRWIAGLVVGFLLASIIILREPTSRARAADLDDDLNQRAERHARHASSAAARLRVAQVSDSVRIANEQTAERAPIRVLRDAAFSVESQRALDSAAWRAVDPHRATGAMGIDVVFVFDTLTRVRGAELRKDFGTRVDYVLPRHADDRCAVIAHVERGDESGRAISRGLMNDVAREQLVGPCAYLRAFGMPGPRIDQWLRTHAWRFAGHGSWVRAEQPVDLRAERKWLASPFEEAMGTETTLFFLREMQLDAVRCAAGQMDACTQMMLAPRMRGAPVMLNGNILFRAYRNLGDERYFLGSGPLGRREPLLLADMVRTLGRERFARFWTSSEEVPVAFESAAGESLGEWTSRWMVAHYGPVPPRGAGVSTRSAGMSLALVLFAIAAALGVNARRQFR